jgi:hypothetical protein
MHENHVLKCIWWPSVLAEAMVGSDLWTFDVFQRVTAHENSRRGQPDPVRCTTVYKTEWHRLRRGHPHRIIARSMVVAKPARSIA